MKLRYLFPVLILLFSSFTSKADSFEDKIKSAVPNITKITKIETKDGFKAIYEILLTQEIDHNNPNSEKFNQRVFLFHKSFRRPMLYVTEGYNAGPRTYELSHILKSNQLIVEYRYNGKSKPDKMDWTYLKNDQAMEDLHKIRVAFGNIYKKKWISTGISKGGTTCMMYKTAYPNDVEVGIPYVGPLAIAQEDTRTDEHIMNVGTQECRDKLTALQRAFLKHREYFISQIEDYAKENKMQFTVVPVNEVLEFAVCEYTFSFWQWGMDCDKLPSPDADKKELYKHLLSVVGFDFYNDATCQFFLPAFYQFLTENGYYGFLYTHLEDLLVDLKPPKNIIFGPQDVDLTFTPYCQKVIDFLDVKGDKMLYIYGEVDPWTACGYTPTKNVDALRMTKKGGPHQTRIASFSPDDQKLIYKTLKRWLKMRIRPLKVKKG